ncbi:MAG: YifB family Mg chelatase-like AAA ATPase [Oscillospiraceae bacterium]|nr:YifB family Mg chelatase-like AAA ATPase [Oscillospiraceae bacterium]
MVSEVRSVRSVGLTGLSGFAVSVECYLSQGLPGFEVVGLPDAAVRESRERVRAAMKNCGFEYPIRRIVVNLAPADVRKEGPLYDLPILLGLLAAAGEINPLPDDSFFIGELSLEGQVRPVAGALPLAMAARDSGASKLFVPNANAGEASLVEGIEVYSVEHIQDLILHLTGKSPISPSPPPLYDEGVPECPDFSEVRGQDNIKRALEVAAAGAHNVLMVGPPGAGKSMLARRLPSILPPMSRPEALECTAIHSIAGLAGKENNPLLLQPPFRSPHHTMSAPALVGGGRIPRPGEMSLAHNGVLFLDELPEYQRDVLESLRQPMEDGQITISRVGGTLSFPASFMLVCAMNPCRCGWYGHPSGKCACSPDSVRAYYGRVSGPILDRMDIKIEVPSVSYQELSEKGSGETSGAIRGRVTAARELSRKRGCGQPNAYLSMDEIQEFCKLDEPCSHLMKNAFERLGLTARGYTRILKVARTAADLDGQGNISKRHLAEALQYRQSGQED